MANTLSEILNKYKNNSQGLNTSSLLDEDDFISNSELLAPTQQSTKAYVNSKALILDPDSDPELTITDNKIKLDYTSDIILTPMDLFFALGAKLSKDDFTWKFLDDDRNHRLVARISSSNTFDNYANTFQNSLLGLTTINIYEASNTTVRTYNASNSTEPLPKGLYQARKFNDILNLNRLSDDIKTTVGEDIVTSFRTKFDYTNPDRDLIAKTFGDQTFRTLNDSFILPSTIKEIEVIGFDGTTLFIANENTNTNLDVVIPLGVYIWSSTLTKLKAVSMSPPGTSNLSDLNNDLNFQTKLQVDAEIAEIDDLRKPPVADIPALKLLTPKNYEIRKVEADGYNYVFEEGNTGIGTGVDHSDAANTGVWVRQLLPFTIREIDNYGDLDNLSVTEGEIFKITSNWVTGDWDAKLITITQGNNTGANYEFQSAGGGTFYAQPVGNYTLINEYEDSGSNPVRIYASYDEIQSGDYDLPLEYETFKIRRKPGSINPYLIKNVQGGDITIPADDFDWYEFQRLDIYTIRLLGKPYSSGDDKELQPELVVEDTFPSNVLSRTLLKNDPVYHYLRAQNAGATVVFPADAINGTKFAVKNDEASTFPILVNNISIEAGEIYEAIYTGTRWMEL